MSLDDRARRAAQRALQDAALMSLDPEGYRNRRQRRGQVQALALSGAFIVVVLFIGVLASPEEEVAVTTSTLPSEVTTTTRLDTTTTTVGDVSGPGGILGAGWEALDPGPIDGRYRMASVWTDYGLFVFGGHDNFRQETPSNVLFHSDAFLYDPASQAWRELAEIPQEVFEVGQARALSLGDRVFVYGQPRAPLSGHAAIYDLGSDTWVEVDREFGDRLGPDTQVVWTGEYLVAPSIGRAYDPIVEETIEIPPVPDVLGQAVHSPPRAHWSGSEVLVVGSGPVYAWAPGDTEWQTIEGPPVPGRARDSVWTDQGLLVVNYQMAAAFLDPETLEWNRPGDLPLRFYEDLPDALAVGGTPVVRMASGLAIWQARLPAGRVGPPFGGEFWIPVPLAQYGDPTYGWSNLIAGDIAIYSVGGDRLLRFRISRDEDDRIIPPTTLPIGAMFLDVPQDWEMYSTFAPEQSSDGTIPEDETIGASFVSKGTVQQVCDVSSTYSYPDWSAPDGFVHQGLVVVDRPGRYSREGVLYRFTSPPTDWGGTGIAILDENGSDVVFVMCEGYPDEARHAAESFVSGLWSPWEGPSASETPEPTVGTGWEELEGSPVAGRMRVAAAWTGEELFVWGGHEGYAQETPGSAAFYQGAHLYDPRTGTWRPASEVPEVLCPVSEASATWIGDTVLVHGDAADLASGCLSSVATYDPVGDEWTVVQSQFFTRVPHDAEVVWTGEWLAAPAFGLVWVPGPDGGRSFDIPVVPDSGFRVGSPTMFHWDGEQIVAIGAGDVYTLVPGDDRWEHRVGIGIPQWGRRSVLTEHGLFVVTRDGEVARVVDLTEVNLGETLPLRLSECDAFLVAAGDLPVAQVGCSGMAIWDPVRSFWVPIPMDVLSGWSWQPTLIGTDDAVYSIGERFLRYPISHDPESGVIDPSTIPVGVMQLDIPSGFRLRATSGVSTVAMSDGSVGEVVTFVLDGRVGSCLMDAWYQGREVPEDQRSMIESLPEGEWLAARLGGIEPTGYWLVAPSLGDTIWIDCESPEDAEVLATSFWLP